MTSVPLNALFWLEPAQAELAREVAALAGVRIVAAGSPARGHSGALATELGCRGADDVRAALAEVRADPNAGVDGRVDMVVLLAPGDLGTGPGDARALVTVRERGVRVLSSEPIPASALEFAGAGRDDAEAGSRLADAIRVVPLVRFSTPMREAAEVIEAFGVVTAAGVESFGAPYEASLGAHVFSSLDLLSAIMGEPESIDAAYVAPGYARGVHAVPGESLRGLRGDMTANLRFPDGRSAMLIASDHGGRFNRAITLLGPGGRLRIYDDGFEWISAAGKKQDQHRLREARGGPSPIHSVRAYADAIARLADPTAPNAGRVDWPTVLAMSQAMLLSARTGQPESPATIRRMATVG